MSQGGQSQEKLQELNRRGEMSRLVKYPPTVGALGDALRMSSTLILRWTWEVLLHHMEMLELSLLTTVKERH